MLKIILFPFTFFSLISCFSQLDDCEKIFDLYSVDSTLYSKLYSSSYCEGVIESYNKSIPMYLIPESSICSYWALEKSGIKIIENDLDIAPVSSHEWTAGFNLTTELRVKNDLNLDFDSLRIIDSSWVELKDHEFTVSLKECFDFFKNDSNQVVMYLDKSKVRKTPFQTLIGTEFINKRSEVIIKYEELINGIKLSKDELESGVVYLEFYFENYKNPNNICLLRYTKYIFPITVKNAP